MLGEGAGEVQSVLTGRKDSSLFNSKRAEKSRGVCSIEALLAPLSEGNVLSLACEVVK